MTDRTMPPSPDAASTADRAALDRELASVGAVLQAEVDPTIALDRLLTEARRLTAAEAGTMFVRDQDVLRFVVVQNDFLMRRVGNKEMRRSLQTLPLPITQNSLAGYVAITGEILNIPDVDRIPPDRPYIYNSAVDIRNDYKTHSVLSVAIRDRGRNTLGVLQLINPFGPRREPMTFTSDDEYLATWFAEQAALFIPEHQLRLSQIILPSKGTSAPPRPPTDRAAAAPARAGAPGPEAAKAAAPDAGNRLGDHLLAEGLISLEQLGQAVAEQKRTHQRLGAILVRMNVITEQQLTAVLSRQWGLPTVEPAELIKNPEIAALVPAEIAKKRAVVPVRQADDEITVAVGDPTDFSALDDIAFYTGLRVAPVLAPLSAIRDAVQRLYDATPTPAGTPAELGLARGALELVIDPDSSRWVDLFDLQTPADDPPAVQLVNTILLDGLRRGASDIHLQCFAASFRVRYRIDGVLHQGMSPPKHLHPGVVARIKAMAALDVTERGLPQDGRMTLRFEGRQLDLRVSVLPTLSGESVDLRVADGAIQYDLAQLGFDPAGLEQFLKAIHSPNGVVLVAGPTGSGKTTTLYAALTTLNRQDVNILALEDPVETVLEGVNQVHVSQESGSFAGALRSLLKHDPDVMLVGELRDIETAQTAVRAGMKGHLILSTLHTSDCASTIHRMLEMGVPPFVLAPALRIVVAQRLIRKVCTDCRETWEADEGTLVAYGHTPIGFGRCTFAKGKGCQACNFTGMKGRVGIFEVMPILEPIHQLILRSAAPGEIRDAARRQGMKTLREAGLMKVLQGVSTLEEVVRQTST